MTCRFKPCSLKKQGVATRTFKPLLYRLLMEGIKKRKNPKVPPEDQTEFLDEQGTLLLPVRLVDLQYDFFSNHL